MERGKLFHTVGPWYKNEVLKDEVLGKGTTRSLLIAERVLYLCELLTKLRFSHRYSGALLLMHLYMRQAVK